MLIGELLKPKSFNCLFGINISSQSQLVPIKELIESGIVDYIEILIDNFIFCDPITIRKVFGSIPIAFHIMRSQFLERDIQDLKRISSKLKLFIREIRPIYVSDHLACFNVDGLPIPVLDELNYVQSDVVIDRVNLWQNLLDTRILFENFPSIFKKGRNQASFFTWLSDVTQCGILFDISNFVIASKNIGVTLDEWENLLKITKNFHAGGFSRLNQSSILIDSHDCTLAQETKRNIYEIFSSYRLLRSDLTLTIEFDFNIDYGLWAQDICLLKKSLKLPLYQQQDQYHVSP